MTRLFVYGTLKRGGKNHHHMVGRHLGDTRTAPGYRLYHLGNYPGMIVDATDTDGVTGEVWDVDAAALAHLDEFEGVHEGLYRRAPIALPAPFDGVPAFTYLYLRDLSGCKKLGPTWTE